MCSLTTSTNILYYHTCRLVFIMCRIKYHDMISYFKLCKYMVPAIIEWLNEMLFNYPSLYECNIKTEFVWPPVDPVWESHLLFFLDCMCGALRRYSWHACIVVETHLCRHHFLEPAAQVMLIFQQSIQLQQQTDRHLVMFSAVQQTAHSAWAGFNVHPT